VINKLPCSSSSWVFVRRERRERKERRERRERKERGTEEEG
jgi:hypothetical protein